MNKKMGVSNALLLGFAMAFSANVSAAGWQWKVTPLFMGARLYAGCER